MEEFVDLNRYMEWEGKPGTVKVPEVYDKSLRYEIVVFARKERGGSDFTFQCCSYKRTRDGQWQFDRVMQDKSKHNTAGVVVLQKIVYHPKVILVNIAFMVYPRPEGAAT